MKIAGFEFKEGARFQSGAHVDPKVVGAHIEMLREKFKGEITPEDVLDDAKHDNSPLHSFFEWSDSKAAHQHRLNQARGLIRAVVAIYVQPDKPAVRQVAYVHIKQGETSHYRETSHAMSMKSTRVNVLRTAWNELQQWKRKYRDLKEFAELIEVVDRLEKTIREIEKA